MGAFTINYGQIVDSVVTECIVSNVDAEGDSKQNNGVRCLAIWDSGATSSIITRNIIDKLNLQPVGVCQVAGIHGTEYEYTYYVDLMVPGEMTFNTLEVTEGELEDVDILIGMGKHGVKLLHDRKNSTKRCEFLRFYLYLCHVMLRFHLF